ncbi:hypothetical protein HDU76_010363 [Blyttiomyces sp. JEL0837]|nr:hypothetical protein HDU76_010363 [Blyttiomyces sp. JEL0837]
MYSTPDDFLDALASNIKVDNPQAGAVLEDGDARPPKPQVYFMVDAEGHPTSFHSLQQQDLMILQMEDPFCPTTLQFMQPLQTPPEPPPVINSQASAAVPLANSIQVSVELPVEVCTPTRVDEVPFTTDVAPIACIDTCQETTSHGGDQGGQAYGLVVREDIPNVDEPGPIRIESTEEVQVPVAPSGDVMGGALAMMEWVELQHSGAQSSISDVMVEWDEDEMGGRETQNMPIGSDDAMVKMFEEQSQGEIENEDNNKSLGFFVDLTGDVDPDDDVDQSYDVESEAGDLMEGVKSTADEQEDATMGVVAASGPLTIENVVN